MVEIRGSVQERIAERTVAALANQAILGFSRVPWKLVIESRLGQRLAATVRSGAVSWEIGRLHGPAVG